jgi:hypothetical protein
MESQLEDDLDTEVETMRRMYKEKLTGCRYVCMCVCMCVCIYVYIQMHINEERLS